MQKLQTKDNTTINHTELWHIVSEYPLDNAIGVRMADRVVELVKLGQLYERMDHKKHLMIKLRKVGWPTLWITLICSILSAIGFGFAQISPVNHYANVPRNNVGKDAYNALSDYYDKKVPYLRTIKTIKTTFTGLNAWEVVLAKRDNTHVCVFVWASSYTNEGEDGKHNNVVPNC